ncbi:MAG: NUDIX domain-containing protein [Candidatus Promineifilaceae bacterium]|nr:NUDIX domain-containing protein [Candidatus Promineifilaceae bacterium]
MSGGVTYCVDEEGELIAVPTEQVTFRPAVYGILIDNGRVILKRRGPKNLWRPLGGRLACGQTPAQVLQARFRASTGFVPVPGPMLLLEEQHRVDEEGKAWHLVAMYYALRRPAGSVAMMNDRASQGEGSQWVPLEELTAEAMLFGYQAVDAARNADWHNISERQPDHGPSSSRWN